MKETTKQKLKTIGLFVSLGLSTLALMFSCSSMIACDFRNQETYNNGDLIKSNSFRSISSPFTLIPTGTYVVDSYNFLNVYGFDNSVAIHFDSENYGQVFFFYDEIVTYSGVETIKQSWADVQSPSLWSNGNLLLRYFSSTNQLNVSIEGVWKPIMSLSFHTDNDQSPLGIVDADTFTKNFSCDFLTLGVDTSYATLRAIVDDSSRADEFVKFVSSNFPLEHYYVPYWLGQGNLKFNSQLDINEGARFTGVYLRYDKQYITSSLQHHYVMALSGFSIKLTNRYVDLPSIWKNNDFFGGGYLSYEEYINVDYVLNSCVGKYNQSFINYVGSTFNPIPNDDGGIFSTMFALIVNAFTPVILFMSIPIGPGLTVGSLLLVPLFFGLIFFLIKLIRGS